jgi:protein SCO1/2
MTNNFPKKFNKRKVAVLFLILLLPSFFYVILSKGEHFYRDLPFIGPKEVVGTDTVYHTIPEFSLIDQNGQTFTQEDMLGNIYVVDFFFTRCPTICPKMAAHLLDLQNKFSKVENVRILSHTVDPKNDSPEVLKEYSKKVHADNSKWTFVTGNKEEIYSLANRGYFASAGMDETAPGGFLHSELIFLVDKNGRLRGSFDDSDRIVPAWDGTSTSEMKKLADAIDNLLLEEFAPKKEK